VAAQLSVAEFEQGQRVKASGYRGGDKHDWYGELIVLNTKEVAGYGRMIRVFNPRTNRSTMMKPSELERVLTT
jgi:hypothetical protein